MPLVVALPLTNPVYAQESADEGTTGVEVIRRGDVTLFKYRDAQGNLVIEDRPPPQFFEVDEVEPPIAPPEPPPVVALPPPPPPEPFLPRWLVWCGWAILGLMLLGTPVLWFWPQLHRWWRETPVDRALRLAELPYFADVKLSLGAHTLSEVDRMVRTPAGILILSVEKLHGEIRGTANDDQWVRGTSTIVNPLARVRLLAPLPAPPKYWRERRRWRRSSVCR